MTYTHVSAILLQRDSTGGGSTRLLATQRCEPLEAAIALGQRLGIDFDRTEDQLGRVWICGAPLGGGAVFEMSWRPDLTDTAVAISVDDFEGSWAVLCGVVEALALSVPGSVSWLSPDVIWWTKAADD